MASTNTSPNEQFKPKGESAFQRNAEAISHAVGNWRERQGPVDTVGGRIKNPQMAKYFSKEGKTLKFDNDAYDRDQRHESYGNASKTFVERVQKVDAAVLQLRQALDAKIRTSTSPNVKADYTALSDKLYADREECFTKMKYLMDVSDPNFEKNPKAKNLYADYTIKTDPQDQQTPASMDKQWDTVKALRLKHPELNGRYSKETVLWEELYQLTLAERSRLIMDLAKTVDAVSHTIYGTPKTTNKAQETKTTAPSVAAPTVEALKNSNNTAIKFQQIAVIQAEEDIEYQKIIANPKITRSQIENYVKERNAELAAGGKTHRINLQSGKLFVTYSKNIAPANMNARSNAINANGPIPLNQLPLAPESPPYQTETEVAVGRLLPPALRAAVKKLPQEMQEPVMHLLQNTSDEDMVSALGIVKKMSGMHPYIFSSDVLTKPNGTFTSTKEIELRMKNTMNAQEKMILNQAKTLLKSLTPEEQGAFQRILATARSVVILKQSNNVTPSQDKQNIDNLVAEYHKNEQDPEKRMEAEGALRMKGVDIASIKDGKKEYTMMKEGPEKLGSVILGLMQTCITLFGSAKSILSGEGKKDSEKLKKPAEMTSDERKKELKSLKDGLEKAEDNERTMRRSSEDKTKEIDASKAQRKEDQKRIKELRAAEKVASTAEDKKKGILSGEELKDDAIYKEFQQSKNEMIKDGKKFMNDIPPFLKSKMMDAMKSAKTNFDEIIGKFFDVFSIQKNGNNEYRFKFDIGLMEELFEYMDEQSNNFFSEEEKNKLCSILHLTLDTIGFSAHSEWMSGEKFKEFSKEDPRKMQVEPAPEVGSKNKSYEQIQREFEELKKQPLEKKIDAVLALKPLSTSGTEARGTLSTNIELLKEFNLWLTDIQTFLKNNRSMPTEQLSQKLNLSRNPLRILSGGFAVAKHKPSILEEQDLEVWNRIQTIFALDIGLAEAEGVGKRPDEKKEADKGKDGSEKFVETSDPKESDPETSQFFKLPLENKIQVLRTITEFTDTGFFNSDFAKEINRISMGSKTLVQHLDCQDLASLRTTLDALSNMLTSYLHGMAASVYETTFSRPNADPRQKDMLYKLLQRERCVVWTVRDIKKRIKELEKKPATAPSAPASKPAATPKAETAKPAEKPASKPPESAPASKPEATPEAKAPAKKTTEKSAPPTAPKIKPAENTKDANLLQRRNTINIEGKSYDIEIQQPATIIVNNNSWKLKGGTWSKSNATLTILNAELKNGNLHINIEGKMIGMSKTEEATLGTSGMETLLTHLTTKKEAFKIYNNGKYTEVDLVRS